MGASPSAAVFPEFIARELAARLKLAPGEQLAEDFRASLDQARKDCGSLTELFARCLASAEEQLTEAARRVEHNRAKPTRDDDWFDDSIGCGSSGSGDSIGFPNACGVAPAC